MKNIDKIYEIISNCSCPITVSDILKRLNVEVNKTTVYRNIENLLSDSKIIEDFSPSGEKLYSKTENHHHHFICNNCLKKENIGCFIESYIKVLESKFNFKVKNHSFVLNGVCKDCS